MSAWLGMAEGSSSRTRAGYFPPPAANAACSPGVIRSAFS